MNQETSRKGEGSVHERAREAHERESKRERQYLQMEQGENVLGLALSFPLQRGQGYIPLRNKNKKQGARAFGA